MGGVVSCTTKLSNEDREVTKKNKQIESYLQKKNKSTQDEIKLLLLGPGESGKSTIFKQMRLIQAGGGFSEKELRSFRYIVYGNIITQMKILVTAVDTLNLTYQLPENNEKADQLSFLPMSGDIWSLSVAQDVKSLWSDPATKEAFSFRDRFYQLNESSNYFFNNIDRIMDPKYLPTNEDILRVRVKTTGVDEAEFTFDGIDFRMLDVGGQRSERRKWIHCFDCVTVVLFCAAMSEYDQTLREDFTQNRMRESLLLFDEILSSPWFKDTSIILLLNKTDLLQEKIKEVPLTVCFPKYTGQNTYEEASEYIKDQFVALNKSSRKIYTHYTCAISPEFKAAFAAIKETILKNILSETFMI